MELAKEARDTTPSDRPVYIAGSISRYDVPDDISEEQLDANYRELAGILAENGCDLLLLEMLGGPVWNSTSALKAAVGTGLPTWVGISSSVGAYSSSRPNDEVDEAVWGDAVDQIMAVGGEALLVLHSEVAVTEQALRVMGEHWTGPRGSYPHSGTWIRPNWQYVNMISPADYLTEARKWVDSGVQIIGGCCGIGLQHVELLRQGLPTHVPVGQA